MADAYAYVRGRVARRIKQWSTGTVTLTRSTPGERDAEKPWLVPTATLDVYALDARVDGVIAEYVNDTTIFATDEMVIASPKARHTLSDGEAADGAISDIEPRMSDTLQIDGATRIVKQIKALPAAGQAAMFHIVIAS